MSNCFFRGLLKFSERTALEAHFPEYPSFLLDQIVGCIKFNYVSFVENELMVAKQNITFIDRNDLPGDRSLSLSVFCGRWSGDTSS